MNIRNYFLNIAVTGAVASLAVSCSVLESLSNKLPGEATVSATADSVNAKVTTESAEKIEKARKKEEEKARKAAEKKTAKEKKEAEKKAREQRKKDSKKKTSQTIGESEQESRVIEPDKSSVKLDFTTGTWHLRSINGYTLSADIDGDDGERPYLIFEEATGRFYGNDGCNTVNGSYYSKGDSLRFDNMLATMRMCPDAKYAQAFRISLAETRTCAIIANGAESNLELRNEKGKVIMTLAKPDMEYLNGSWQIIKINGHNVDTPDLKLVIDLAERRIHGNTGCNVLNGNIFIEPDKPGVIQFQQIAVTMALCPDAKWETQMLVALESVETANRSADNEAIVTLIDNQGNAVLTLKPMSLNER